LAESGAEVVGTEGRSEKEFLKGITWFHVI